MWIEHVRRNGQALILAPRGLHCSEFLFAPEFEPCPFRRTCSVFHGVDPTFDCHFSTSDHPLYQIRYFLVHWCSFAKWTSLHKYWSEKTQWLVRYAFSAIYPIKPRKGCQKGWKTKFLQIRFSAHPLIGIVIEVPLSCFEVKRCSGWGVVAQYVKTQCQIWTVILPRPLGRSVWPQTLQTI